MCVWKQYIVPSHCNKAKRGWNDFKLSASTSWSRLFDVGVAKACSKLVPRALFRIGSTLHYVLLNTSETVKLQAKKHDPLIDLPYWIFKSAKFCRDLLKPEEVYKQWIKNAWWASNVRRLAKHCLVKTEHFEFTHCFVIFSMANLFMAHVFHLNQYLKCRIVLKKVFFLSKE